MKGYSKCKNCERVFATELMTMVSGKKYCPECAKDKLKQAKDFKALNDYIYEHIEDKSLMPLINKQIKDYVDNYQMKYSGILYTLKYCFELNDDTGFDTIGDFGLSFLPFYYAKAKKFFLQSYEANINNQKKLKECLDLDPEKVVLKRSELVENDLEWKEHQKKLSHNILLNLDDIEDDEDYDDYDEDIDEFIGQDFRSKNSHLQDLDDVEDI